MKEARERLNQNSHNSSRPPSREAPWEKPDKRPAERLEDESEAGGALDVETQGAELPVPQAGKKAAGEPLKASCAPKLPQAPRRAGKIEGAPGHGREAPERIDVIERHAPACCGLGVWLSVGSIHTVIKEAGAGGSGTDRSRTALKRKAVGLTESFSIEAQGFGQEVLNLWTDLQAAVHKAREGPPGLIGDAFEERLCAFRIRCEAGRTSTHKKTRELAGEFLNDWGAIFAVLDAPRWPLTNNAAERALRHWVILRQLTHGTRIERGSRGLALLASVIDTCRQLGHSPWAYLQTAITRRRQNLALLPLPV